MKLLIATTNLAKLAEIKQFLADIPIELVSLKEVGVTDSVEETGKTFEENAILKARFYAKKSGLPTLADDGGFEIDALGGEPGIKSRRWLHGERDSTDEELIVETFRRMKDAPEGKRGARLTLVLTLAMPSGEVITTAKSAVRGVVAPQPSPLRHPGFPYRSILFLPEIGKFYDHTLLTPEETARLNHRKRALEHLKPALLMLASRSV